MLCMDGRKSGGEGPAGIGAWKAGEEVQSGRRKLASRMRKAVYRRGLRDEWVSDADVSMPACC